MEDIRQKRLKELAMEYQETRDASILSKIITRVDALIWYQIWKISKYRTCLKKYTRDELYNTCVVGVIRAVNTTYESEVPPKFFARIIAYIRNEIDVTFKHRDNEILTPFETEDFYARQHEDSPVLELVENMKNDNYLDEDELYLLYSTVLLKIPLKKVVLGSKYTKNQLRYRRILLLKKVKRYIIEHGYSRKSLFVDEKSRPRILRVY